MGRTPTRFKQHRVTTRPMNCYAVSRRLRRSRHFFSFSPIRTWTAVRELGVCESGVRSGFDARCHQIPSECTRSTCSLNQWVRSLVGLFMSAGTGEYFPPLQFTCGNCGGGDRGRVAIYRPFGEFHRS
ncbi:hypothetical protein TNCV_797691 [Trichonephila clavipes]|nr:hypothetical protein TNCV_797691 [Trichonephila clavipes]